MAIIRKISLPVSAQECAASATMEADPVNAAAQVLAAATRKFAPNAISTVVVLSDPGCSGGALEPRVTIGVCRVGGRSSCVIGVPNEDLGNAPHALVELAEDVGDDELDAWLRERLAGYKLPKSFERVSEPLRDDAGKVRRSQLRAARLGSSD